MSSTKKKKIEDNSRFLIKLGNITRNIALPGRARLPIKLRKFMASKRSSDFLKTDIGGFKPTIMKAQVI